MKIELMGTDRDGDTTLVAMHRFEFHADGVTHYIDGSKRAEVPKQSWADYCASSHEAHDAHLRMTRATKGKK